MYVQYLKSKARQEKSAATEHNRIENKFDLISAAKTLVNVFFSKIVLEHNRLNESVNAIKRETTHREKKRDKKDKYCYDVHVRKIR